MIKPHDIEPDVWATITSAEAGNSAALHRLIDRDRRLARCEYWYTPAIHFAVRGGHLEGVKVLLEADADPEWNGYHCGSLVAMARYRGYEDVAKLLEQAREGRGRVAASEFDHPIHAAAKAGDAQRIRELLDADPALVSRGARCGCSPLHRAVLGGAHEAVALLLDRGADIHALHGTGLGAAAGWWAQDVQAIDLAIWGGPPGLGPPRATRRHEEIAKLLLDRGADPNWPELGSPTGGSLQRAAGAGNRQWVELLLAHGADPNSSVDSGGNATFAAKTPELRALLMARGGEIEPADQTWIAVDDEVMRQVMQDPRATERNWATLFTSVCTNGRRDLLARLLKAGFRVPMVVTGCQGYLLDNVEMFGMLLANGMNPDLQNWQRQTLLHSLAAGAQTDDNRVKCAALLLDAGASISARDDEYRSTPLGWAARNGVKNMVEFLLERGAATNHPDDEAWATPLSWAERLGHVEIAERLRRDGAWR
jgi:ankyrin repeat protein